MRIVASSCYAGQRALQGGQRASCTEIHHITGGGGDQTRLLLRSYAGDRLPAKRILIGFWGTFHMDGIANIFGDLPLVTRAFAIFLTIIGIALHFRFNEKAVSFGPTILTTTGIFATFVGITVGLFKFDTTNIQGSVPALLSGLQTAFVGSAFGVFWALTLKYRDYFFGIRLAPGVTDSSLEVTAGDMVFQLKEIIRALVGGEDGSLISQIKLLRQDTNDRLDVLKAAQIEALAKLSEMGSKALVEALRDVIKDFNAKISEQFGDNFKELNAAVGQLLVWQRQYKEQVETIVTRLGEASHSMTQATGDYTALVEKSGIFTNVATELSSMLRTLNDDRSRLQTVSAELAKLLVSAQGSLPQVEQKVLELTNQLTNSVTENQKRVGIALTDNATAIRNSIQTTNDAMSSSHKQHVAQITELVEKTKQQVTVLDKALSEELEKSLNSLGRQLTALSERFVADYTPLTDKLRRLVEAAR